MRYRRTGVALLMLALAWPAAIVAEEAKKHEAAKHPEEVAHHVGALAQAHRTLATVSDATARQLEETLHHVQRAQEEGRSLSPEEMISLQNAMAQTQQAYAAQSDLLSAMSQSMQQLQAMTGQNPEQSEAAEE